MNIFISGGCKNGKSHYAQELVRYMAEEKSLPMYYIATMISTGPEDNLRIKRHIKDREGCGFITLEQPRNLCDLLDRDDVNPKGAFLMHFCKMRCSELTEVIMREQVIRLHRTCRILQMPQEIRYSYRTISIQMQGLTMSGQKITEGVWPTATGKLLRLVTE